jgi:AcrR family transcriptional regulator
MPDKLAQSAFTLFSREGIKNVSLSQIAAHAGVTKGSLYWHYRSKDDLIKAACEHYYQLYHRRIAAALARITHPVQRLEETLRVSVRICLLDVENRVFSTEVLALGLSDPEVRRGWQRFHESVHQFYVGLVKAARLTDGIRTAEAEQAVDFMLATMEGIKLQAHYDTRLCNPKSEKAIVANLTRMLGLTEAKR